MLIAAGVCLLPGCLRAVCVYKYTHTHTHMYIYILMYVNRHTFTYILSLFLHLSIIIIGHHLWEDYEFPTDNSSSTPAPHTPLILFVSLSRLGTLFSTGRKLAPITLSISPYLMVTDSLSLHTALPAPATCPSWMPPYPALAPALSPLLWMISVPLPQGLYAFFFSIFI